MEALLKAEIRIEVGSRACAALRGAGFIPAVLYGKAAEVKQLKVDQKLVSDYFRNVAKQELNLECDGENLKVSISEVQRHPISRDILHLDFLRI
jgi:large subunit ribosomal protein L25